MSEPVIVSGTPLISARNLQPTKKFRLKRGAKSHHHLVDGEVFKIQLGDTVELTARQAEAFGDKFESVDGGFDETTVDRAAGVVHREGGNVTADTGVKTTTPGELPAPQPEAQKSTEVKKPEVKK